VCGNDAYLDLGWAFLRIGAGDRNGNKPGPNAYETANDVCRKQWTRCAEKGVLSIRAVSSWRVPQKPFGQCRSMTRLSIQRE